jgi:hypothetical protein
MGSCSGLGKSKLYVFALNQILVLRIRNTNRGKMNEDVLTRMLAVTHRDKTIASLVVKPLNLTDQSLPLRLNNLICGTHVYLTQI